jgi:DNA modification methylase
MKTSHEIIFEDSKNLSCMESNAVDLIVTSPPYPMIEMWDELFCKQNQQIEKALKDKDGNLAHELMHCELDYVWNESYRVLKDGGIACINVGDATRKVNNNFQLYTNHSRILQYMQQIGFSVLPAIIWRKPTNSPKKFMGSGVLPPSAYVTLEHEYILILRKGSKRTFTNADEQQRRRESALFWEERNTFFSDVWFDLVGTQQHISDNNGRSRSGAFPFKLAYRIINMYSIKEDLVLDPFLGTGTTTLAAIASGRNSRGYEIDNSLQATISDRIKNMEMPVNEFIDNRINNHLEFIENHKNEGKILKYRNKHYDFEVKMKQEIELKINRVENISVSNPNSFLASYLD